MIHIFQNNGYFITRDWWENKDTRAVMSFAVKHGNTPTLAEIVANAVEVLSPRRHGNYAKGLLAYDAWRAAIFNDDEFPADIGEAGLRDRLMCQNDAMDCLMDGRHNAARFFKNTATQHPQHAELCDTMAAHFEEVFGACAKMRGLLYPGGLGHEEHLRRLADSEIRGRICVLIDEAKSADTKALDAMKQLLAQLEKEPKQ